MVPEIWSEMDRIFCHFLPFFALLPPNNPENQNFEKMKNAPEKVTILHMYTKNHHHMIYASWDMKCDRQNVLSLRAISCPFTPLTTQKVKLWKNETYVKKVGYTSEFLFGIYWWTWKTNWSGPIKKIIILIYTMLHFYKKIKKNTCRYHYWNLDDIIYSSWDEEQNILKLVILGHFLPFYPP